MRIFNEDLSKELFDVDEAKGRFDTGEYITIVPEQRDEDGNIIVYEHEESEPIRIFYPYSDDELKSLGLYEYSEAELKELEKENKLNELRNEYYNAMTELSSTDYKAIKYAEGYYTEEEYKPIKEQREKIREKVRELEDILGDDLYNNYI